MMMTMMMTIGDYPLTKLSDDDDDIRIQLGTFKNGVLTIDEGHTTLGEDALEGYKKIRKVVFPSTLREIDGCFSVSMDMRTILKR